MNRINLNHLTLALLTLLFAGCSSDSPNDSQSTTNEISIKAQVWQVMQASAPRRATTYNGGTLSSDSFTASAYVENTTTSYINPEQVNWITDKWVWSDGKHYWPASGNLDFFAYMPATPPSYISGVDYTAAHNVTFTCSSLPMTYSSATPTAGQGSSLKEFMFGMALAQNKDNAGSGVTMIFQHPFTRIKLQLAASHPDITINSITFRSIYNNGSYNHSASPKWSTTGVATDFTVTLSDAAAIFDNNPASPTQISTDFIMIPQDWTGEIVVNADCLFWGNKVNYPSLTTTIPTNWQPGYSYTYTFNISPDDLIVNIAKFTEQW